MHLLLISPPAVTRNHLIIRGFPLARYSFWVTFSENESVSESNEATTSGRNEKPLAVEGEGLPWSERSISLLLVGLFKASLYPLLDIANSKSNAALAELHRAGKLS